MDEKMKLEMSKLTKKERQLKENISKIIENRDPNALRSTINHYINHNDPAIVSVMFEVIDKEEYPEEVKIIAAHIFGSYPEKADTIIPRLIEFLDEFESNKIRYALLQSLGKLGKLAEKTIPKLEEFRNKSNDIGYRNKLTETIEIIKNAIIYPKCPNCKTSSFAYHPLPSTSEIISAKNQYSHQVKSGISNNFSFPIQHNTTTFAAIVYCLECGHIISAVGGFRK